MCLTLANASVVRDHQDSPPPARGYTRTQHHVGYLAPGDLWRPGGTPEAPRNPRTVMAVSHHLGEIVLTDQYGVAFHYAEGAVIPTAVADAWTAPRIKQWN